MAPRAKEKVKRASSRTRSKTPAAAKAPAAPKTAAATKRADSAAPPARLETRIKSLEQERDRLKSDLEAARMRIAALEESRSAVANRIDWVIERLGGVVERGD
ncbi:DUF4164 family protein [Hyphomicrobium sp.]|uniref:DUF4164 family protein n=1 Tax=Hyphomicrobium sp. TaxID=82 RepID=UPI002BB6D667|nr:DUF4164 family protein [Hyphomicrobium sp.]HRN89721.1 DUF4164 family protein [Hyphomicrobium sp.]HRQ27163.1 DUF4164 family protein [Hyphomicrobium sp.]